MPMCEIWESIDSPDLCDVINLILFWFATFANSRASYRLPAWLTFKIAALHAFTLIAFLRISLLVTVKSSPVTNVFGNFAVNSAISSNASSWTASSA